MPYGAPLAPLPKAVLLVPVVPDSRPLACSYVCPCDHEIVLQVSDLQLKHLLSIVV